ncbi:N-acetyltransferase [Alkalihalobacillus sp. TS-13]|uniref:GNAT family N-acetyltransferase n=1 Tax=Alkalihalobacillus sp. TS-13 TaxID=2842455 RepID=UPI001C88324C|nr:GNAT family N-acetyltransferase [Alkalihalobacillus sp. TS-13]
MINVTQAVPQDLDEILVIDNEVIGNSNRRSMFKKAIHEGRCLAVRSVHSTIKGVLIYQTEFFDCSFISLVIVHPSERRKGYASRLIKDFEKIAPTEKIFSSTNQSNERMQSVFSSLNYEKSGYIENLDEGDPEIIFYKKRGK